MNGDNPSDDADAAQNPDAALSDAAVPDAPGDAEIRDGDEARDATEDRKPRATSDAQEPPATPEPANDQDTQADSESAAESDARWAAFADAEESRRGSIIVRAVVGLLTLVLIVDGVVLWNNWEAWTGCFVNDDRVIDEQARLCYDKPEGWTVSGREKLWTEYDGPGTALFTSGLQLDIEFAPLVHASPDGEFYLEEMPGKNDVEQVSEALALGSSLINEVEGAESETEAITVDGCEAATTTAHRLFSALDGDWAGKAFWSRVTVVDVGDGLSFLYTTAVVDEYELEEDDGTIADLETMHDSLSVG